MKQKGAFFSHSFAKIFLACLLTWVSRFMSSFSPISPRRKNRIRNYPWSRKSDKKEAIYRWWITIARKNSFLNISCTRLPFLWCGERRIPVLVQENFQCGFVNYFIIRVICTLLLHQSNTVSEIHIYNPFNLFRKDYWIPQHVLWV